VASVTGMMVERIFQVVNSLVESVQVNSETGLVTYKTRGGQIVSAGNVDRVNEMVNRMYPVGTIYFSTSPENPATTFGVGTWTNWGSGRIPIGVDSGDSSMDVGGKIGGSKKISVGNLPAHKHASGTLVTSTAGNHTHNIGKTDFDGTATTFRTGRQDAEEVNSINVQAAGSHTHNISGETTSVGSGMDFLPPYIAVYMWRRAA
jgi:hypothetical protein